MKCIKYFFCIFLVLFVAVIVAMDKNQSPFSFEEILAIQKFPLKAPSFLQASDKINLAYYAFVPHKPKAVILFYHGGGLYSNTTYQYSGLQLQNTYNIASYFVDIRGHGNSGGPRGDAPSVERVLQDVTEMVQFIATQFPTVPVYLVGHSSGAGLLLNYSASKLAKPDLYKGLILIAPYLGPRVGVERVGAPSFVKSVRVWIYLLNMILNLPLFQHIPAVFFNYPQEILQQDPLMVTNYSYIMSCATTPDNPQRIFEQLNKPCTLYIGQDDEQFDPEKVAAFAEYNKKGLVTAQIIPDAKHLSILVDAAHLIEKAIEQ